MEEIYTPKEAAVLLKVTNQTILNWIHNGTLKAIKLNRSYRITQSALDELLTTK